MRSGFRLRLTLFTGKREFIAEMYSGALDRKIIIESTSESRGAFGEVTDTWATYATLWAQAIPISGKERLASDRTVAVRGYKFKTRWISGVTAKMRVSYDGEYWNIIGIAEIGRREGLEIIAEVVD